MYLKKSNSHPDYDHQKHLCTIFSRKTGYSANLKKISLYCLTRVHNRYNVHKIPQGKPSQKMGLWKYKAWWLSHVTCSHLFSSTACWALSRFFFLCFHHQKSSLYGYFLPRSYSVSFFPYIPLREVSLLIIWWLQVLTTYLKKQHFNSNIYLC